MIAKKILYVCPRFLPCIGGTEIHTYEVAKRFAEEGHEVTVLTTDVSGSLPKNEIISGIKVIRTSVFFPKNDFYLSFEIMKIIKQGDWDVVHCQGYHTFVAPLAMFACIRANLPFVLSFHSGGHSSAFRRFIRPFQVLALRPFAKRASALVGTTDWEINHFSNWLRLKNGEYWKVSNGTYLPEPSGATARDESEIMIVSIGRLEKYKGHQKIVEALPFILKKLPNARLTIVGNGPYKNTLTKQVNKLDLQDIVTMTSFSSTERSAFTETVLKADLITILSDYESQGMAALEALFLGKKVLLSESSALVELTKYDLARSVPLNADAQSLAESTITHLVHNATDHPPNLPTWDEACETLKMVYRHVEKKRAVSHEITSFKHTIKTSYEKSS